MTNLNKRYQTLNSKQKEIVDWRQGLLHVNACPGSGKTESIAFNIAKLVIDNIESGTVDANKNILAFSFTQKAAKELKARIHHLITLRYPKRASVIIDDLSIVTIDKYCRNILSDYDYKYNYFKTLNVGQWNIYMYAGKMFRIRQDLIRLFNKIPTIKVDYPNKIKTTAMINKLSLILGKLAQSGDNYWIPNSEYFDYNAVVERYLKAININKIYSYNDYQIIINKLLETEADFKEQFKNVKYLFVDEVQDINHFQEKLINAIIQNTTYSILVGDNNQAIYSFRGGDIECVKNLFNNYDNNKSHIELNHNYRSSDNIINNLNKYFVTNKYKKIIKDEDKNVTHPVYHYQVSGEDGFFKVVKNNLITLLDDPMINHEQIAILVRSNKMASRLSDDLNKLKIAANNQKILVQKWFSYSKPINDNQDVANKKDKVDDGIVFRFLNFVTKFEPAAKNSNIVPKTGYLINDLYSWLLLFLQNQDHSIKNNTDQITATTISWFMEFVIDQQILNRNVNLKTFAKSVVDEAGNWKLFLLWKNFANVDKNELLRFNKVNILTHHSAKGKEWDIVFNYNEKNKKDKSSTDSDAIDYVAFSRAKHIFFDIRTYSKTEFSSSSKTYDENKSITLPQYQKNHILPISFSSLDNFTNCLYRYKVFNIYFWKSLDNNQKVEGTLIHKALELYNKALILNNNNVDLINDNQFIEKLQEQVYIRKMAGAKRTKLKKQIQLRIPNIMNSYHQWLINNHWKVIRAEYEFDFLDETLIPNLKINFTGQIDLLLQSADSNYTIVDFKILTGYSTEKHEDNKLLNKFKYQIKFYAWILSRHFNYNITNLKVMRLVRIKDSSEEAMKSILAIEITPSMLDDFETELRSTIIKINDFNNQGFSKIEERHCIMPNCGFSKNEKVIYQLLEHFDYQNINNDND